MLIKHCLTLVGSESLNTNLGIFIPKLGLDIATADKFTKQNGVKINDEDKNKNPTATTKHNKRYETQQHSKLKPLGEILSNRFS